MPDSDTTSRLFDLVEFGKRLAGYRASRCWTLKELASKCDLSTSYICELEKGRCEPSLRTGLRLAWIFGLTVEQLATGEQ